MKVLFDIVLVLCSVYVAMFMLFWLFIIGNGINLPRYLDKIFKIEKKE